MHWVIQPCTRTDGIQHPAQTTTTGPCKKKKERTLGYDWDKTGGRNVRAEGEDALRGTSESARRVLSTNHVMRGQAPLHHMHLIPSCRASQVAARTSLSLCIPLSPSRGQICTRPTFFASSYISSLSPVTLSFFSPPNNHPPT